MDAFRITVLAENTAQRPGLGAQHGLCVLVERGGRALLFDTGASGLFLENAKALGADLTAVCAAALSHNHYDHTGGWLPFRAAYGQPCPLYIAKDFFRTRGWDDAVLGWFHPTTGPLSPAALAPLQNDVRMVTRDVQPVAELPGACLLANLRRTVPFETPDGTNQMLRGGDWVTDDYADEMALVLDAPSGLVVLTGCAHTGVCSIVEAARTRLGRPVAAVIGGTHLVAWDEARARQTAAWLQAQHIGTVGACHCTGETAQPIFAAAGFQCVGGGWQGEF